jgi:sulfite reductase alpha subunit-like flavoprotein
MQAPQLQITTEMPSEHHDLTLVKTKSTASSLFTRPLSPTSSRESLASSDKDVAPISPMTEHSVTAAEVTDKLCGLPTDGVADSNNQMVVAAEGTEAGRVRRASMSLISQDEVVLKNILGDGETGTALVQKFCCGGGCCLAGKANGLQVVPNDPHLPLPDNDAFRSLNLNLGELSMDTPLTQTASLPQSTTFLSTSPPTDTSELNLDNSQPPQFVQPHPPYHTFPAAIHDARALTKPGAEKRTYHFDIDVTDYPEEIDGVDFRVGGAIGICPPNDDMLVNDIFERLGVPRFLRDKPTNLSTNEGRWPTIWGDDQARRLVTTRRELLTWCVDLESSPPTKSFLRVLAEHASDACEKKILTYLVSAEGQGAFCDLRTSAHTTVAQLLYAFPSSMPPMADLLSTLKQLMPRFYSLSNDPVISSDRNGIAAGRRLIEIAVSVHETADWSRGVRTGVGSGYLERIAKLFMARKSDPDAPALRVPLFRGLMSNPLSREFVQDGPMLLIGAGVGMAPFRGFILNRLKNATCANKVWLLQGVRDSSLDELYSGELGSQEHQVKRVVESRKVNRSFGEAKYVQEELLHQKDVVWLVINSVDGRVFVCGSSKGMGEGVHESLLQVVMEMGNLSREEAERFWQGKKEGGQYITETW